MGIGGRSDASRGVGSHTGTHSGGAPQDSRAGALSTHVAVPGSRPNTGRTSLQKGLASTRPGSCVERCGKQVIASGKNVWHGGHPSRLPLRNTFRRTLDGPVRDAGHPLTRENGRWRVWRSTASGNLYLGRSRTLYFSSIAYNSSLIGPSPLICSQSMRKIVVSTPIPVTVRPNSSGVRQPLATGPRRRFRGRDVAEKSRQLRPAGRAQDAEGEQILGIRCRVEKRKCSS